MITRDGEISEISSPPNKADQFRTVTVWIERMGEHMDVTIDMDEFVEMGLKVGDKIRIQIEKRFDVDAFTRDLFKNKR